MHRREESPHKAPRLPYARALAGLHSITFSDTRLSLALSRGKGDAMLANLTPAYHAAERQFQQATTIPEKIEALQQMLAVIPKHKGTDHMRADLRRRLGKLRQEAQQGGKAQSAREALLRV